jgi:hypothetical protein
MPQNNDFSFDLYRLTIQDSEGLMNFMGHPMKTDDDILSVIRTSCNNEWDHRHEATTAIYDWGLRNFVILEEEKEGQIYLVTLAKATIEKDGAIFTPNSVQLGTSVAQPPPANYVKLIFYMKRHLVAVEYNSSITNGQGWLKAFHEIVRKASVHLKFSSTIELQEKPKKSEILKTFMSFQRLTRIKVQLLLPNPELSRFTQSLYDELRNGGVRQFLADMRNLGGLSQAEQTLPHAAAAMAEDGYKKGEVILEGIRGGRKETVKTGTRPARGKVEGIKDFVRGQATTTRTQEGKNITEAILKEIDRVADEPEIA